jgi:hypothetical protein
MIKTDREEDPTNAPGGDASAAKVLTPYTVAVGTTRAYRVCWLNYEALEPWAAAFVDGEGMVMCAAHCILCTGPDCDHPQYAYAAQEN